MNNDFEFDLLMKKMAVDDQQKQQTERELPSPGVIWWRAQILKKQADAERIERPVKIMRAFSVIICVVVMAGLWIEQADAMRRIFSVNISLLTPALIAVAIMGIGFIGLMLRNSARFKKQV